MRPNAATAAARTTGRAAGTTGRAARTGKRPPPAKPRGGAASSSRRVARSRVARPQRSAPRRVVRTAAPRVHRRVSGPARRRRPAPVSRRDGWVAPAALRLARFLRTLPDRRLVYRLVQGQWWIVLIGFLLMGIVAMQVSLLGLNAGIGRDVERSASLLRRNGELRAQVSRLSSSERIQTEASALGMVMPPAGAVSYVRARGPKDVRAAADAIEQGRFAPGAEAMPLPGSMPGQQAAPVEPQTAGTPADADAADAGGAVAAAGTAP